MYDNIEKELFKSLSKNIQSQIAKLDELDIYTSRHIHSVPQIVNKICKKLNYNEERYWKDFYSIRSIAEKRKINR